MKRLGLVPIATLKNGDNVFTLEGKPQDFGCETREVRENPSFQALGGKISVRTVITRSGQRFLVRGVVFFRANLTCALCGEEYEQNFAETMVAEFTSLEKRQLSAVRKLEPEDLDRVPIDSDFIDLTAIVRDAIHLAIPIAPKCRDDCGER